MRVQSHFLAIAVWALAAAAGAQTRARDAAPNTALEAAQARHARDVAACNAGNLPAPQREACVRDAGLSLDRARASQTVSPSAPPSRVTPLSEVTTQDGRATLIRQSGTALQPEPPSAAPPETRTTQDGRATIVPPSDSTMVRPGTN